MSDDAGLIERLTTAVGYLRIVLGPSGPNWLACEPLLADPVRLRDAVAPTATGRGTDRAQVAMSLFVQGYAFRIASLAIGAWLVDGLVVDVDPTRCSVSVERDRPNAVGLDRLTLVPTAEPLAGLHASLVDDHLASLVSSAHAACRVGEALLWGNVAAACASAFGAFTELPGRRLEIRDRAEAFFSTATPALASAGAIVRLSDRWAWERKSCCLWYSTDSGFRCEDCSLWTQAERQARYAAALASSA